ncbi:MAG: trypsin-like peptidase domain-containing protein, partial [Armatimonadota bacterium]
MRSPAFAALLLLPFLANAQDTASQTQTIAEKLRPSLVRIRVLEAQPVEGREVRRESFGSGAIISPDGYVVTNHHVAGKALYLKVTFSDKTEAEAKLVGTDPQSDIAVIKLAPRANGQPYVAAEWGDSSTLKVGQPILAMGCPYALSQSVTSGIISNTELVIPKEAGEDVELDGVDVGSIVRWIGHDAAISPGNSGGPLVD